MFHVFEINFFAFKLLFFFLNENSLRPGSHLYVIKRCPDSQYVMRDTNKSKVRMSPGLGSGKRRSGGG